MTIQSKNDKKAQYGISFQADEAWNFQAESTKTRSKSEHFSYFSNWPREQGAIRALLKLEKYLAVFIDHFGLRDYRDLVLNYCTSTVTARNDLGKWNPTKHSGNKIVCHWRMNKKVDCWLKTEFMSVDKIVFSDLHFLNITFAFLVFLHVQF